MLGFLGIMQAGSGSLVPIVFAQESFVQHTGNSSSPNAAVTSTLEPGITAVGPKTLTVTTNGTGGGTVTDDSDPPGINCGTGGSDCYENYPSKTVVTLNAMQGGGPTAQG